MYNSKKIQKLQAAVHIGLIELYINSIDNDHELLPKAIHLLNIFEHKSIKSLKDLSPDEHIIAINMMNKYKELNIYS